jgi:hypothetical protein
VIEGIAADYLTADSGYYTGKIVETAQETGMKTVIPPEKKRREQRYYDKYIYRLRYSAENAFLR